MNDITLLKWHILADAAGLLTLKRDEAEAQAIAKAAALFMLRGNEFVQPDGTLLAATSLDAKRLKAPTDSSNAVMAAISLLYQRNQHRDTLSVYWEQIGIWFWYVAENLSRKQQLDTLVLVLLGHAKRTGTHTFEVQGSRPAPYTVTLNDATGGLEQGFTCTCMGAIPAFSAGAPCKHVAAAAIVAYASQWGDYDPHDTAEPSMMLAA